MFQVLFFSFMIAWKNGFNVFSYFFIDLQKSKQRVLSALSLKEIIKKTMRGISDAWSTSHLSQRTSEPAYYIVDCRIYARTRIAPAH